MNRIFSFIIALFIILPVGANASGFELLPEKVTDNIYALVGEVAPRTKENQALNNTMGFVITDEGVVLIGTGATEGGAKLIEATVAKVTDKPINQVINIGSQDHHWLGNRYFASKNIPILALARTVNSQKEHVDDLLFRLKAAIGTDINSDQVVYADSAIEGDEHQFTIGGIAFELKFLGDAHFPGDAVLWLPKQEVIFSGDMVYHDRMLGVHPFSRVGSWHKAFKRLAELNPKFVIPGHGHAGTLEKSQKDTGDYLDWLVTEISKAKEEWEELSDVSERLKESNPFTYLKFYESWNGKNISRTYTQFEVE